jgi:hypothetical protein
MQTEAKGGKAGKLNKKEQMKVQISILVRIDNIGSTRIDQFLTQGIKAACSD